MFSIFGQTVKKDDGNDPWDGIRRNMGTGRVKSCVVTKINYMKKSKQAYIFFLSRNRTSREQMPCFKQDTGLFTYQRSGTMWEWLMELWKRTQI